MAKSFNDLATRGLLKYNVAAGGNAQIAAGTRIMKILLSAGTAASTMTVYNAATAAGTDFIKLTAPADGTSPVLDLGPSGIVFDTGVSTGLSGVGAIGAIFYLED